MPEFDNHARARAFVIECADCSETNEYLGDAPCGDPRWMCIPCEANTAALEQLLNEAEDRGGTRAALIPTADEDTVDALRTAVRELLESFESKPHGGRPLGAVLDDRAADIVQVIVGNFRVRLMDEVEAPGDEPTLPGQPEVAP